MSYLTEGYYGESAATAAPSARAQFIKRTYLHLTGAVVAFVALTGLALATGVAEDFIKTVFVQKGAWIGLMVLFIAGGFAAQYMARSRQPVGVQYAGLALYVLLEVVIFLPILYIATTAPQFAGKNLPLQAGIVTLLAFGGLTAAVVWSGKDFSFMGPFLWVASFIALGFVIAAVLFGFNLGLVFAVAMVALAAGFIIYDTSNVLHQYGTNEHVAAALSLFASVALMFWYVLRIFMSFSSDD